MAARCNTCGKSFRTSSGKHWHAKNNCGVARSNTYDRFASYGAQHPPDVKLPKFSRKHKIWADEVGRGLYEITDNRKGDGPVGVRIKARSHEDAIEAYLSGQLALENKGRDMRRTTRVPKSLPRSSRSAASRISGLGPKGIGRNRTRWPIGDLYHAKLAIQYINAGRGDKKDYPTIIRNIRKHYPNYNWEAELTRKVR